MKQIAVFGAVLLHTGKAGADLDALDRLDPHHRRRDVGIEPIEHRFTELENQIVTNFTDGPPAKITVASETIKFRLDEVGADLLSQVEIVVVLGDFGGDGETAFDPTKPRRFIFDRPFLLALREKSASQPYLLCWVAHPDIMVPSESVSESGP